MSVKTIPVLLAEQLARVIEQDPKKRSTGEAVVAALIKKAAQGDVGAVKECLRLARLGSAPDDEPGKRRDRNTPLRSKRQLLGLKCLRLHLQGMTQIAIAQQFGVSQPTVARYIERARLEQSGADVTEIAKLRAVEVEKCNMREQEAYEAWERSLARDTNGKPMQDGDPRFLGEAADAARDRAKLLGLNITAIKAATPEQVARILALVGIQPGELPE